MFVIKSIQIIWIKNVAVEQWQASQQSPMCMQFQWCQMKTMQTSQVWFCSTTQIRPNLAYSRPCKT